ncbi:unnamed protein product [Penicillium salamii]|uniref:Aminoglycoside phosphotransferase domain-containing protein n=1 Tax=Penicillium salamii TaxID=1612424 RepID=A0A9W4K276_9EURO|nr:unnamed protein product [Penicillium salamii]
MSSHGATLPLLRGNTTLESALEEEDDVLLELGLTEQHIDFFVSLYSNFDDIENIASYHLGLGPSDTYRVGGVNEWVHGSFNVCIRKKYQNPNKQALIRFPLPYKVGEARNPGNVDEKLRCEAATFIWIHEKCPEVPMPQLWGFGLVGGQSFTKPQNIPLVPRFIWSIKRSFMWLLGYSLPCPYICHPRSTMLESGYLIMDYFGNSEVQMLSETWDEHRHQKDRRTNLFKGLSRIMLSLSRVPMPRIGSWTLHSDGGLRFSNRTLNLRLHQLENGGIPTNISRNLTYSAADAYNLDLLSCHDRHLHPSNIFVDSQWNIKFVIDLEWACSLPAETLRPPYWLTGRSVDEITGEHLEEFRNAYEEFVDVFEEEEKHFPPINNVCSYRSNLMRNGMQVGNFWYFHALDSPKGCFNLFQQHMYPMFTSSPQVPSEFSRLVSDFWASNAEELILAKLRDKEQYDKSLCQLFDDASACAKDEVSDQ